METITLRIPDAELKEILKKESRRTGESLNKLVVDALKEKFQGPKHQRSFDDLDHLAGTWTLEELGQFTAALADLQTVNPEDWQ